MNDAKYIGLDVHQATISAAVRDSTGKLVMEAILETKAESILQLPSIGPIRSVLLLALIQTPHRFRTKRQLWTYCGLALETRDSGEYRVEHGHFRRVKKAATVRGLNKNHNHDLKNLFKGAATRAAAVSGPFHEFYAARVARGMRPSMVRLTLARKIAAIALTIWKKGAHFDAEYLKQAA
jgi:transposase